MSIGSFVETVEGLREPKATTLKTLPNNYVAITEWQMTPHRPFKINNRKMLEWLYDQLYSAADKLFKKHNPCQIKPQLGGSTCIRYNDPRFGMCCQGCRWLGKNGCTVKALSCKLWYCYDICANRKYGELVRKLNMLHDIACHHNLYFMRQPKNFSIERAYRRLGRNHHAYFIIQRND